MQSNIITYLRKVETDALCWVERVTFDLATLARSVVPVANHAGEHCAVTVRYGWR
jgi:hypothetical protein